MRRLRIAASYKRDLQLLEARGWKLSLLELPITHLLNAIPLPPQYRDHMLHGKWKEHRDFHVQGDWVVIYRIEDDDALVLVRTGAHSDLFKK